MLTIGQINYIKLKARLDRDPEFKAKWMETRHEYNRRPDVIEKKRKIEITTKAKDRRAFLAKKRRAAERIRRYRQKIAELELTFFAKEFTE